MTKILLVEDAYDLAKMIISELEAEGYHVFHMCDGVSALEAHTTGSRVTTTRPDHTADTASRSECG